MRVSLEETERRINYLKSFLNTYDVLLVFSPVNIFYFTDTFVRGVLVVTKEEVKLLVNRPLERAKKESRVPVERLKSLKDLTFYCKNCKKIGVESNYFKGIAWEKFKTLFDEAEVSPIDRLIDEIRALKSEEEVIFIKKAGQRLNKALKRAISNFAPGIKEIEASAILEKELRLCGHPGFTRSRNGFELTYGYLISGKEGLFPTHFITGEGGKGIYGFPGGATTKVLKENEPIMADFSGFCAGYYIDQTRMLSFTKIKEAEEFYKVALEVIKFLEKEIIPGVRADEVYEKCIDFVKQKGYEKFFMKHGEDLGFVGHGVGLEIDEPPYIAKGQKVELKENMVIALEPKFHVKGLGVVGIEDTFVIKKDGLKRLSSFSRKWHLLKR
ncbi:MAG: aminopeptidase P family protein [Thermodesulfobacteria bacterium]|nr:aminopeptidase P family protein [Thermodesulfobacteriota bacterium]